MSKPEKLSQLATLLEQASFLVRDIVQTNDQAWFWTDEVQTEIKQAQKEIKQGDTKSFDSVEDLIADLQAHV